MRLRLGLALVLLLPGPARAEGHWALRSVSTLLRQSDAEILTPVILPGPSLGLQARRAFAHSADLGQEWSLRHYGGLDSGPWRLEWNLLGRSLASSDPSLLPADPSLPGRSRALQGERRQGGQLLSLELDQFNLRWQGERASLVLGRQSVNLAQAAFYFSPLDLFAPFAPQENYRDFRTGVDALRLAWAPSSFSLVEALAVAGYRPAPGAALPDTWNLDGPQGQGSLLLRAQAGGERWAASLLAGRYQDRALAGASLQVEAAGSSWGLEGVWAGDLNRRLDPTFGWIDQYRPAVTVSHSRQWTPKLSSRFEQHWESLLGYDAGGLYRDEQTVQTLLSLDLQADPLWLLSGAAYRSFNGSTEAYSLQWSAERSLSDESALTLNVRLPVRWDGQGTQQEPFLPYQASVELRCTL